MLSKQFFINVRRSCRRRSMVLLTSMAYIGTSMSVLNAADARPKDIHKLPAGSCDVRNSSNSFALRRRVFSSEVEKLKRFCFDLALKLALYTLKTATKNNNSHNTVCVTYKAKPRW